MSLEAIDLEDAKTFDADLASILEIAKSIALGHRAEEQRLQNDPDGSLAHILRPNEFSKERQQIIEQRFMPLLEGKKLLVWHYTRLLPHEAKKIERCGMEVTTSESMKTRLMDARDEGLLSECEVAALIEGSPLRDENQNRCRSGKLYFVPKRFPVNAPSVELLTSYWGGEVVYFWQKDPTLKTKLKSMGVPSVVEAVIPLCTPWLCHRVAETIFDNLGNPSSSNTFDCWIEHNLPKTYIVEIHQPGSPGFAAFDE